MKWLVAVLLVLLLCSCAYHQWHPVCRHDAVYCAVVVGEEFSVRFAYGSHGHNNKHVVAQAYIDDEWICLGVERGVIVAAKKDYRFAVTDMFTFSEYMERVKRRIRVQVRQEK